ncbi:hypothetical protein LINPERPRIM_LOCUS24768 [Linum perenne]
MKDKSNAEVPFGGITVVFGDFRQTLPFIPKATRTQIVNSSIKRSYLWQYMTVMRLTENKPIPNYQRIFPTKKKKLSENFGAAEYFAKRAILAPFHEIVSQINSYMLDQFPGEEMCYHSYDSIQSDCVNPYVVEDELPLEFLNYLQMENFPNHQLTLKVGVQVILLRNIDQTTGLCNGTRMMIRTFGTWFIEVKILMGTHVGERVYLPV